MYKYETGFLHAGFTMQGHGVWSDGSSEALANYAWLSEKVGIPREKMVRPRQTHTSRVVPVTDADGGAGVLLPPIGAEDGTDGLVTDTPGLLLCTSHADCTPVYLADPVHRAIGLVHSGRRGTAGGIAPAAAALMQSCYGTRPENLLVVIGPHICGKCYQVGEECKEEFRDRFTEEQINAFFRPDREEGKYLLDMEKAISMDLRAIGIAEEHMETMNICTFEDRRFYSYRRGDNKLRGLAVMTIRA